MSPDYPRLVRAVLDGYTLNPWGDHGIFHWARVLENGLRLSETTGADPVIIRLFAVFHDSRRLNESFDPGHGRRGAAFAALQRGAGLDLPDGAFAVLSTACEHHTDTDFHTDPTIQTCWDADRLDLNRVNIKVKPTRLNTPAAKSPAMIDWATRRAKAGFISPLIEAEWGVAIPKGRFK